MQKSETVTALLSRYNDRVQEELQRIVDHQSGPIDFYGMMRYHLGWVDEHMVPIAAGRGKGLRGSLLLLVSASLGGAEASAVPLAAGIELLHNFSLVHDDFEDGSITRRHRSTVWSLWGAPIGINVGDGLYALAHAALYNSVLSTQFPDRFVSILRTFDQAALRICEGQHLDMTFEQAAHVSVDQYLQMIGGKSATLIAVAASIGACAAGATEETIRLAHRFGLELGMAFQMQDDLLGIWGDEKMTGKSVSSDIASRKKTLPVLLAVAHSDQLGRDELLRHYSQGQGDGDRDTILQLLERADAHARSKAYIQEHWESAMDALQTMDLSSDGRNVLRDFAHFFIARTA